jgi:hypothetical protein
VPYQSQVGTWKESFATLAAAVPPGYGAFLKPLNLMNHDEYRFSDAPHNTYMSASTKITGSHSTQGVYASAAIGMTGSSNFLRTDEYQFSALIVFLSRRVSVTTRSSSLASQK